MSRILVAALACLALDPAGALASASPATEPLTVAVASNFAAPMRKLAHRFEVATGHSVAVIPGSTGKHYAQIVNGAPFDVFFAADEERPRALETRGWAVSGTRFTYALGRLVLWSPSLELVDSGGRVLQTVAFRRLALANPRLAPYGRAAQQTLAGRGLLEALSERLVFGENVAQAFHLVATGNADLGFVALAQLEEPGRHLDGSRWSVPAALHDPIAQQAVLLRDSPAGRRFLEHVRSPASGDLIRAYGYEAPAGDPGESGSERAGPPDALDGGADGLR